MMRIEFGELVGDGALFLSREGYLMSWCESQILIT